MSFIGWIIIGGIAGWIAEKVMNADHGIFMNILMGVLGAVVGGWVFGLLGLGASGFIGSLITAAVGACIIIYVYRLVRSRSA